jgi:chloride channel protein, CIC family
VSLIQSNTPRLVFYSVLLGFVGAAGAQIFIWCLRLAQKLFITGIAHYTPPAIPPEGILTKSPPPLLWLIPICTTLGGLISGIIVYSLAPEAEGHGTDAMVDAFHKRGGLIRGRVPIIKTITSAITIGSGGSAGREGPTAQISAGVGSALATIFKLDDHHRRILMLTGAAAGLSAVFRSPLGTALFVIEVLYSGMEFEAGALLYTTIGAVVAYSVSGHFSGWSPIFHIPQNIYFHRPEILPWYAVLGILSGVVAVILPWVFYKTRDLFNAIPVPKHIRPAIGGLLLGLLAMALPQVLGGGYGWMQMALDGSLPIKLMLILVIAKIFALSFTIGSGGSGGVFAPSLYIGTMLGAAVAGIANYLMPGAHLSVAAFGVVGMAAFFAAAARVPFATLMMVAEMTGGYKLLVPTMLAVAISYLVQYEITRHAKYRSLYEAQVPNRAESPVHHEEYLRAAINLLRTNRAAMPDSITPLNLHELLSFGAPISVGGTTEALTIAHLRDDNPLDGHPLSDYPLTLANVIVLGVVKSENVIVPSADTILEHNDQLLVLISPEGYKKVNKYLVVPTMDKRPRASKKVVKDQSTPVENIEGVKS